MPTTNHSPTLSLACDLIERRSVTPEDAGCQPLMRERLEAIGFRCETLIFGEGDEAVENLWAVHGTEGPIFCFAGHTDVVPTGPESQWKIPPFKPTVENDMLYGRGAADMKGSLASMIIACEEFIKASPNHSGQIAFLITADEEGPAKQGTVKVVEWLEEKGIKLEWCLVGEPSSTTLVGDTIKNGRRGSLGAELKVKGKQGHVAYPHLANNPIHRVAPALTELSSEIWDEGNDFFPATSFQISNINGGTGATNVIPGNVDIVFNFRFSTELTADEIKQRTHAILDKHQLTYDLIWNLSGQPFLTAEGKLVEAAVQSIESVTGRQTQLSTAGGTSDGRFIAPTGAQVVELGPVNATIHQVDECVKASDLEQLSLIYESILKRLLP
ncbi:MAG: succinyl-diaminopimelate desuccinylase [Cellvibrionaceae bacterium]